MYSEKTKMLKMSRRRSPSGPLQRHTNDAAFQVCLKPNAMVKREYKSEKIYQSTYDNQSWYKPVSDWQDAEIYTLYDKA